MVDGTYFVVGGAGFIGSHFCDRLLEGGARQVTVYDNFVSGREWHLADHAGDPRFRLIRGEVADLDALSGAMRGHDAVIHLASNADLARAVADPSVDFHSGTYLTHQVVEAMRLSSTSTILYASGSGVYGDLGTTEVHEDHGPLIPVSTYGASKLAGEALIAAYCHMFDMRGCAFRFGNVVGPRQTHGVGYDFIRRLREEPGRLRVLGDGSQSKPYVYVDDVVSAVLRAHEVAPSTGLPFRAYNVATDDTVTVREIALLALDCLGRDPATTRLEFGTEPRGWKGDVPIVRLNTERIRSIGWTHTRSSRQAMIDSMRAIATDNRVGGAS